MSLDLRNFVNININYNTEIVSTANRGIVTLITKNENFSDDPFSGKIFYSASDYYDAKTEEEVEDSSLDNWVEAFFGNGGKGLQIVGGFKSGSVSQFLIAAMKKLAYPYVIVVSDASEQDLRKAASSTSHTLIAQNPLIREDTVPTFSGINEKMFISSTTDRSGRLFDSIPAGEAAPAFNPTSYYSFNDADGQYELLTSQPDDWASNYVNYFQIATVSIPNYVIKVGQKGIEVLAAAYLSKVRVSDPATIQDYAFTIENVNSYFSDSIISDNDVGVALINANFLFDTELVNSTRNYTGNTVKGIDMMNYYVKILLTQDLSTAVMNLLASKIRFNQSGVNRLSNAISQAMNAYVSNGYLNTDYIWTGDDIIYNFNGVDYVICPRNTPLVKGYKCVILPLTSLTSAQKEAHVLPPVYVLLADQTGIRAVVINGDIY